MESGKAHRCLKAEEVADRPVTNTNCTFLPPTMKVTSFFFTLGLGVLALAGHETRTNVRDLSAQSSWDSTIGKGAPALVELYVL